MEELHGFWKSAAIAHGAFAIASLTIAAAFVRRFRLRGRSIVLLLALLTLSAFFVVAGVDAYLHAESPVAQFTAWTRAALVLQALVGALGLHFFAMSVEPWLVEIGKSKWHARILAVLSYSLVAFLPWLKTPGLFTKPFSGQNVLGIWAAFFGTVALLKRHLPGAAVPPAGAALNLSAGRIQLEQRTIPATALDLRSLGTAVVPGLLSQAIVFVTALGWSPATVVAYTLIQLATLPSLAGLLYFQTRATFFDLLIKRGAVLSALCLAAILAANAAPLGAALAVAVMAWTYAAVVLHSEADRWLDRVVFHRPDYRHRLAEITAGLAKTENPTGYVTRELADALRAVWVRFGESPDDNAVAFATVASAAKRWGVLSLGPRQRGLAYQSQDAIFVDGVAAQLSATLEGAESRAQRQWAAEAEVRALRAQINPHFLFNSLNSLADMVKDAPQTEETVMNLARVFRHALTAMQAPAVPLAEELRFLESYLRIEQVRFEDRLRYTISCSAALENIPVPPMLIQPLVENAIQHGLSRKIEGGTVRIAVETAGERLRICVEDDGAGFEPGARAPGGSGIGLENVRRRVESLPEGRLTIDAAPDRGSRITLEWKP